MNELIWIGPAFVFGVLAARIGLPPMVGYLIGGFILNALGIGDVDELSDIGDLGVTLLLFTIGLKLDVRSLLRPVIWAGTTIQMLTVVTLFGVGLFGVSLTGLSIFIGVDAKIALLIAFALSFSSTVFAVKTLKEKGEYSSRHGQVAIGVLIMQDIIAVIFLVLSTGKLPTVWALALFALIPLRRLLVYYMTRAGHGELLVLYGLALAFGAYALFDVVGLKGDLGALLIGAMLATHPSAEEMSEKLMSFKDLLLVGFFLSIGMTGDITLSALLVSVLLALAVAIKVGLYFVIFSLFKLQPRTSIFASLNLANYSEFGLIVGYVALGNGWLSGDWLVIIALALTMTFVVAAPLNARADKIYAGVSRYLSRLGSFIPFPEEPIPNVGNARIGVIGMRGAGTGAYDTLESKYGDVLLGLDSDADVIERQQAEGRNVQFADVTDDEFWARIRMGKLKIMLLSMMEHEQNLRVARQIHTTFGRNKYLFAIANAPQEVEELKAAGVDEVWSYDVEAGVGFADEVISRMGDNLENSIDQLLQREST